MPTDPSPTMRAQVRQLLSREVATANQPEAVGAAIQGLCHRVSENLRRTLGEDGRDALMDRAFMRTRAQHPVLSEISRPEKNGLSIDHVVEGVKAHGVPIVTDAVESLLAALADILGGLIGADMVMNLLDHDDQLSKAPNGRQTQ